MTLEKEYRHGVVAALSHRACLVATDHPSFGPTPRGLDRQVETDPPISAGRLLKSMTREIPRNPDRVDPRVSAAPLPPRRPIRQPLPPIL
jgi:hypothetical protein